MRHIRDVSTMAEIQEAIEKLPPQEKHALSVWLSGHEDDELPFWESKLQEMAADPQISKEIHRANQEFAATETDGLSKV